MPERGLEASAHVVISVLVPPLEGQMDAVALPLIAVLLPLPLLLAVITDPLARRTEHLDQVEWRIPQFHAVLVEPVRTLLSAA